MSASSDIKWQTLSDSTHVRVNQNPPKAAPPVWITNPPSSQQTPCLRAGHALAAFSNRLYLFAGYCDYACYVASSPPDVEQVLRGHRNGIGLHFNSLHEYSVDTGEWKTLHPGCHPHEARAQALPKPRRHASLVIHGGSLFVYGGFDEDDTVLPDLWEFRIETSQWSLILGPSSSPFAYGLQDPSLLQRRGEVPVARAEHTAVVHGNRMIVFGGYDGKKKLNDTYVYDFPSRQWCRPSIADHNAPSRRCKHSAVVYNKKMYIVGGFQYKDGDNYALTDMHVLDLDTYVWSTVLMSSASPEGLQGHKAVVCGDSMYIIGGKVRAKTRSSLPTSANLPSSMINAGNSSGPVSNSSPNPGVSTLPSHVGATDASFNASQLRHPNDFRSSALNGSVFRYIFDSNRWAVVETSGTMPYSRQLHAAVAVLTEGGQSSIFVFGGADKSKQRFFGDLCELRGVQISFHVITQPCTTCAATRSMLDNKMFSDVRFIIEGRSIHAHRCILYARSEYFQNMFDSRMRETCETDIPVTDVSYDVFHAVLEYLYSGKVRIAQGRLAVDLLKAADMFRIEGLRNLCVEKVQQAVTTDNAAFICQVASTHNAHDLKVFCITYMMENFKDVIKSESFQSLMRQDPGGLGHEILEAYSDSNPFAQETKRART